PIGCMNSSVSISPTVAGLRLVVSMFASLSSVAVIVQINSVRLAAFAIPAEDQTPLLVNADRMETRQIAAQLLKVIAGRHAQVLIGHGVVNHLELAEQTGLKIRRDVARTNIIHKEGPKPVVPKAYDHRFTPVL